MSWVTTEICWYFHFSCCSKHLTSHACALLIDNVGNYLYMYLNNGSFKSEVDPHQFNLRERKKIFKSWQVCDWLAKWLIVLGFMDLRWPRVYRRSNVGLVSESRNLNFWQNFEIFRRWPWKKKSTVLDGFFPYLAQMITSMRGCVAYNDPWPWPISSRSFGLGLENRVRSVASTVLDGFFPYLVQMISRMRRCVACDNLWPWPISSRSFLKIVYAL